MSKINILYQNFSQHCKKKSENSIIFFFILEIICRRNYRTIKNEFFSNKLALSQRKTIQIERIINESYYRPWQYIVRKGLFNGKWYKIKENVFIPRHTSEQVLQILSENVKKYEKINTILEIGVGSGVLLMHIGKLFPQAALYGTDISATALKIANLNCPNAELWLSDWVTNYRTLSNIELIYANPPYLKSSDTSDPLTKWESRASLYGTKKNVVDYYRELICVLSVPYVFLKYIIFEIPISLWPAIQDSLCESGAEVKTFNSYARNILFVLLKKRVFRLNEPVVKKEYYKRASKLLQENKIIVYPTDTCWGIIARKSAKNIRIINLIKERNKMTQIPILFSNFSKLKHLAKKDYHYFKIARTVIYDVKQCGARKIFNNKYFLQSLIKIHGPILASSWNKHNKTIIKQKSYKLMNSFPLIDAFFWDNNYVSQQSSEIIQINNKNKTKVVRNRNSTNNN